MRVRRTAAQIVTGTSARIFTVTAYFSSEIKKGFQSHIHCSLSSSLEAEKFSTYRARSVRRLPRLAAAIGILFLVPFFVLPSFRFSVMARLVPQSSFSL